jgi:hypothetical protein
LEPVPDDRDVASGGGFGGSPPTASMPIVPIWTMKNKSKTVRINRLNLFKEYPTRMNVKLKKTALMLYDKISDLSLEFVPWF